MPTYKLVTSNHYNDGVSRITFEVEAPNAEVAEYLAKKHLSGLFREFPSGSMSINGTYMGQVLGQNTSQHNEFANSVSFEHHGHSVIDLAAARQLLGNWDALEPAPINFLITGH